MNKITGENLKKLRKKRNITQLRLATEVGLSQEAISSFENKGTNMKLDYLIKMADFLNTTVDYIIERTNNDSPLRDVIENINDDNQNELINNYVQLNNLQRKDLIWYSGVLKNKKDQ